MTSLPSALWRCYRVRCNGMMLAIALAGVGMLSAGCTSVPPHRSASAYSRDAALTARVKTALANEDALKSLSISVKTYRGTVELSGLVDSADQITRALAVVRSVDGVEALRSDLHLKTE